MPPCLPVLSLARAAPKGQQLRDKTALSACGALQASQAPGGLPPPRTTRKAPPVPCAEIGGGFWGEYHPGGRQEAAYKRFKESGVGMHTKLLELPHMCCRALGAVREGLSPVPHTLRAPRPFTSVVSSPSRLPPPGSSPPPSSLRLASFSTCSPFLAFRVVDTLLGHVAGL
eukprot:14426334-Alexandrium_andersonii.AAC.1